MALSNHLDALAAKHSFLEHLIREEMQSACPDFLQVSDYKKKKLLLKEEIERLGHETQFAGTA